MTSAERASAEILGAVARLRVDRWTAQVVTGMRAAEIEPVLLKGPVIQRWLYADDPWERTYHDADLLVAPGDHRRAEDVLRAMGFVERGTALPGERPEHARPWFRSSDGAVVDLHRCLHGTESLPRDRIWNMIAEHRESQTVAGAEVAVPDEPVRALHVALHVDSKDGPDSTPRVDLQRAVLRVDRAVWHRAAGLARLLGIEAELGTRLRAVPETRTLTDDLRLPARVDPRFEFRRVVEESGASHGAYSIERFEELQGPARARYALRKLFPPIAFLRHWSPLARRGAAGLAVAYVARVAWCAGRAPIAVVAWRRVRRRIAPSPAGGPSIPSRTSYPTGAATEPSDARISSSTG